MPGRRQPSKPSSTSITVPRGTAPLSPPSALAQSLSGWSILAAIQFSEVPWIRSIIRDQRVCTPDGDPHQHVRRVENLPTVQHGRANTQDVQFHRFRHTQKHAQCRYRSCDGICARRRAARGELDRDMRRLEQHCGGMDCQPEDQSGHQICVGTRCSGEHFFRRRPHRQPRGALRANLFGRAIAPRVGRPRVD
jgi:hypothetical protein